MHLFKCYLAFTMLSKRDDEPNQDADVEVPEKEPENLESDNLTTTETKTEEAIKPKLSGACDPFFFDNIPSKKPPGLNHLVERYFTHVHTPCSTELAMISFYVAITFYISPSGFSNITKAN